MINGEATGYSRERLSLSLSRPGGHAGQASRPYGTIPDGRGWSLERAGTSASSRGSRSRARLPQMGHRWECQCVSARRLKGPNTSFGLSSWERPSRPVGFYGIWAFMWVRKEPPWEGKLSMGASKYHLHVKSGPQIFRGFT